MQPSLLLRHLLVLLVHQEAMGLSLYPQGGQKDYSLSHLHPIVSPYVSQHSVLVPLGRWESEDFEFMCDGHLSVSLRPERVKKLLQ